jgi:hypothetical protein
VNEMEGVSRPGTDSGPPQARSGGVASGARLFSSGNAVAWSAAIAVITGLATIAGMARESGRSTALGLYSLSRHAIDQSVTFRGMISLLEAALAAVVVSSVARLAYSGALLVIRRPPLRRWTSPRGVAQGRWLRWAAFVLVLADVGFFNASFDRLARQADGIILKQLSEVGAVWPSILLDQERGTAFGFQLLFGAFLPLLVAVSCWLVTKIENRWARVAFTTYAVAQMLSFLLGYSFLSGVADTVDEFPAVAFSGEEQLHANSLALLLGSDDKEFALLVVNENAKPRKYILYLPRTEVKWMTVLRLMPLHPLAHLQELNQPSP